MSSEGGGGGGGGFPGCYLACLKITVYSGGGKSLSNFPWVEASSESVGKKSLLI